MKKLLSFVLINLLIISPILSQMNSDTYKNATKFLYKNTSGLVENSDVRPNWQKNGNFYYSTLIDGEKAYFMVDLKAKTKKAITPAEIPTQTNDERPYNRSKEIISPDGSKVVFIKDWNLYVKNLSTQVITQLTTDGIENYGYATDNAGWRKSDRPIVLWSPDSKKLVTYKQDQRHVSTMYLASTTVGAPELQAWKYPLPGDKEIIKISRLIIDIENNKIIPLQIPADPRRGTLCDDIACTGSFDDNIWSKDSKQLAFVSTSRDHKEAKLRLANAETGSVIEIMEEKVETQYESGQGSVNWRFLDSSNEYIWYSERDNWGHLYLYNQNGKLKNQITKGDFVVTKLLKVDEKNRKLYFEAQGKEEGRDPYFSHFYSIGFDGKNLTLLTPENGDHTIYLSPDLDIFVDTYSQPDVPPISEVRGLDGRKLMDLEKANIDKLKAIGWQAPKPIIVKSDNEKWDLYGLMFTPTNLDKSQKYPVVNYIYPGPQAGGVGSRSFRASRGDHQALAELGFVVVVIDGTCNPGRSKAFHDACYGDMSSNTLPDQISGLKQLAAKHSFLDLDKVGMWGHSGGGFATASALFKYPDFYKVGIAESGNHDNRNYEDDWGERYNGLIQYSESGSSNYAEQANQLYAKNLKGKLLLAHGGLDDNVPPYNTYLVVDALVKANKDFDLLIFPNQRHGFGQDSNYMTRKRWDYFVKHLKGIEPPKEFKIE